MQDLLEQADLWLQRRDSPQLGSVTIGLLLTSSVLRSFFTLPRFGRPRWQESFSYRGQKFMQVPTLGLEREVTAGFSRLSPMTSRHSLNLSPMGVNSSSLASCRFGVEVWSVFALTLMEWFLERQGRYCLTCFFLKSHALFLQIPRHCCVMAMQSSLFPSFSFSFSAFLPSPLASPLVVLMNSFLLLITFLFFWKMCLSITKQLWMLLISYQGLIGHCTAVSWARKLPFKVTSLTFQILFINYKNQPSMSTIHLKKKDSAGKRLEKGSEIDVLYHEFQTLKSQIYGVKREAKPKAVESQWSSKGNKERAAEKLRESTIQKCQQEFQENLSLIQTSQHKFKKSLFKRSSQVPNVALPDDRIVELGETPMQSQSHSRKYRDYEDSPSINLEESAKASIAQDNLCFTEGEQLFRDFLNRMQRPVFPQLSASRHTQIDHSHSLAAIKDILASIAQDHLKKLNFLFETLTFMSRKLHCLEMIIQEYGKILKSKFQALQRNQEQQVIINVESLQTKYATELQKLTQFYQQQLRKQSSKRSIEPRTSEDYTITDSLKMENARLNELLDQARCLISTKEQLITALTEENQELREEVDKLKRPNLIRGSAESSLGYSATADKHPKKDGSSHQMELIAERLNLALGKGREDKRGWDDFEDGSQDDINYSELESVRDKSLDQWDISHLQMRQTSNAKSLEQDCLKVMRNRQGEVSQQDI